MRTTTFAARKDDEGGRHRAGPTRLLAPSPASPVAVRASGSPGPPLTLVGQRSRPAVSPATRAKRVDWRGPYVRRLLVTDVFAVAWAVSGAQLFWFDLDGTRQSTVRTALSAALAVAWVLALQVTGSRDHRIVGEDAIEYRRVVAASFYVFGLLAIAAYLMSSNVMRGYVAVALPSGLLALLVSRWMWRRWLHAMRRNGGYSCRVVLVGSRETVVELAAEFQRSQEAGYRVVGAVTLGGTRRPVQLGGQELPTANDLAGVLPLVEQVGADTVAIAGSEFLPPSQVRELSWSLEPGRQHLIVAPGLTDVAGPRIHSRPVAGLPLMHVETPRFDGPKLNQKRVFDVVVAAALLVVLAPLMLGIAVAVRGTDGGPVLFGQDRVGRHGRHFRMLKFRSMVVDAEDRLAVLRERERDRGNAVLFKMRKDPRITSVGRFLRALSLDELPQLLNVIRGDMALVGPRPPLPAEIEQYEAKVNRRFLVKPGITGLWQVNGRSDLSWEDSVRLDLYYVENWSLLGDLLILAKTARAVFAGHGAY